MECKRLAMPGGITAIVCGARTRRRKHRCLSGIERPATLLCDYPMAPGKTCDKPLCEWCAVNAGPDLHHCRDHGPATQLALAV